MPTYARLLADPLLPSLLHRRIDRREAVEEFLLMMKDEVEALRTAIDARTGSP